MMGYDDLYPHQKVACEDIDKLFSEGHKAVISVLPTGAGKTLVKAEYARRCRDEGLYTHMLAHRDVLLSQISDALCMMGVYHNFICSIKTQRDVTNANFKKYGNAYYDDSSKISVVSAVTLRARLKSKQEHIAEQYAKVCSQVQYWMIDEAHHLTVGSSWGMCVDAYGDSLGLGVSATPLRSDKKGLGKHTDGYFTAMSVTTNMIELIRLGKLSPYKIFQPQGNIDLSGVTVTAGGDYNNKQLVEKVNKRTITGSAVSHYKRILDGKRVITFGVDITHCLAIAKQFNESGVPSKCVSSKTPLVERNQALVDLKSGLILNLVNCDLFGEGFDSPAVEGVIMLRPTQSYSLYKQQFGRMLRVSEGKTHGVLLDHVSNTIHMMVKYDLEQAHDDTDFSLDRGSKGKKSDDGEKLAETVTCTECGFFYIAKDNDCCPECGHIITEKEKEAKAREIQEVSGELVELSVDAITVLLNERAKVDESAEVFSNKVRNMSSVARYSAMNNHAKRQHAQTVLRDRIQRWCVHMAKTTGWKKDTVQREFNKQYGIHVMKACTLGAREAETLTERITYYDH